MLEEWLWPREDLRWGVFPLGWIVLAVVLYRKEIAVNWMSLRSSEWISAQPAVSKGLSVLGYLGVLGFVILLIPWTVAVFFGAVWASVFFFAWVVSGFDVSSAVVYANGWLAGYGDR